VLIVDDHDFFRGCLVDLVNASPDLEAVGECRDGVEVSEAVRRLVPDVVLMDVKMEERDGLDAMADLVQMRSPVRVIILSSDSRSSTRALARTRGAAGFLLKGVDGEKLLSAVRHVAGGGTVWPDDAHAAALLG
jgi:DNA-binding NarL/FixJ family response regulator